jgi:hypothetical protein
MTGLVSQDFPSLQPVKEGDEDYSKIWQAMLDLTQLYGNVHEVLYSGMRASNQMMLMGDYVKYVDDFRLAILRWKSLWGSLDCEFFGGWLWMYGLTLYHRLTTHASNFTVIIRVSAIIHDGVCFPSCHLSIACSAKD